MLFVIEGPNRSGKTFLINQLKMFSTLHRGLPHFFLLEQSRTAQNRKEIYDFMALVQYMNRRNTLLITEKHPMVTELVKSQVYDHKSIISWEDLSNATKAEISGYIYCRPPIKVLEGNVAGINHVKEISENIGEIVLVYDSIFTEGLPDRISRITYNYVEDDVFKVVKFIKGIFLNRSFS